MAINLLTITKETNDYFTFVLNGDTANAIKNTRNDLLTIGNQCHFKTSTGANLIKEQDILFGNITIVDGMTSLVPTSADDLFAKLISVDFFAWINGSGSGGVDRFDDLLDTFNYFGKDGQFVVVNESELKLVTVAVTIVTESTQLTDMPSVLFPGQVLKVNDSGTAYVLTDVLNYVSQSITDGVTDKSPSEDVVFDALALKANLSDIVTTPDATTTTKGIVKLAGDLSGTADLPTVPGLLTKLNLIDAKQFGAIGDGIVDDTVILQSYLDSDKGIYLFPLGTYLMSGLNVSSNSKLIFEKGSILYLKNGSDRPALQNVNFTANTDSNIEIQGLYLNGNEANQIHTGVTAPYTGEYTSGIRFFGVKNLILNDIFIYRARTFGIWVSRISTGYFSNIQFDQNIATLDNQDGLHINGVCDNIYVSNISGTTNDDMIALNADDGALGSNVSFGDITNVFIDNVNFKNCLNGIRLLTATSSLDKIFISNLSGIVRDNIVALSSYGLGVGNFGDISIDYVKVDTGTPVYAEGYIVINDDIKNLKISNVHRTQGSDARPTIKVQDRANILNLELENITTTINNSITTYVGDIQIEAGSVVDKLDVKNHTLLNGEYPNGIGIVFSGSTISKVNLSNLFYDEIGTGIYIDNTDIAFLSVNNTRSTSIRYPFYLLNDSDVSNFTSDSNYWFYNGFPSQYNVLDTSSILFNNNGYGSVSSGSLFTLQPFTNTNSLRILQNNSLTNGYSFFNDSSNSSFNIKRFSSGVDLVADLTLLAGKAGFGNINPDMKVTISDATANTLHLENTLATGDGTHDVGIYAYKAGTGYNNIIFDSSKFLFRIAGTSVKAEISSSGVKINNLAGTGTRPVLADASGNLLTGVSVLPYKVYTALVTQSGTSAPVATVLENTLGGTVVWSRSSTGIYLATLTGAFTSGKTALYSSISAGAGNTDKLSSLWNSANIIQYNTKNSVDALTDGVLVGGVNGSTIEIRVYN